MSTDQMSSSASGFTTTVSGSSATAPLLAMEASEVEEVLRVVESSVARIRWRLRPYAKRRLQTDILALCTGLRPVVMVDYGGKLPELQDHLCSLLQLAWKDSPSFLCLRIMLIEEMIYIIHVRELAKHAATAVQPHFVDLERDPLQIITPKEKNIVIEDLVSIQKFLSSTFPVNQDTQHGTDVPTISVEPKINLSNEITSGGDQITNQSSPLIDLSCCMKESHVTIPTLNGWLLGYPVVYLFGKDHIEDAICNLSTKSLHIYKILVCRNRSSSEELMSFSVPYDLSLRRGKEEWCEAFLAQMIAKFHTCGRAWENLRLEVDVCYPQAVVL